MDVLIVGAGSMGTWFGRGLEADVAFADLDRDAAASAAESVDGTVADLEGDDRYDVVCLAVPMTHVAEAIDAHADRAKQAIVDVSGVMDVPLEAMAEQASDRERVSFHPLFAPERAPGSIAVVRGRSGPTTDGLIETLEARGNDVLETTAAEHDEAMETVQAATHAAVLSFALAASPAPDGFETPIYDGLSDLVEQVTEGTPRVYADIQASFDGADAVADAAAELAEADPAAVESLYREAADRWQTDGSTETDNEATDTAGEPE
ncbi:prephenate dehydrogenase/arogenate dehydrogenase family protein [Natrarchaeobaculum sulfurireducens]|uniref:Prephenate dehydrogenase n=1 Tax=Natrarchaeobaculum sulfurireducens TaxID=2044521 RepID=A0A346PFD6_9EURY|nr:prephenate dehydrogenase/arogenate dehydrogenase family protein [Natrarchaeobaculum sulfurireducens]AXR78231.1 Prephenate dehydrogenase [Natrarchaeobaculum sulfurireducens]